MIRKENIFEFGFGFDTKNIPERKEGVCEACGLIDDLTEEGLCYPCAAGYDESE